MTRSFAGLTPSVGAVAAAERRAAWNLRWRFSPLKVGLWQEAFQIGAALAAGWVVGRVGPYPGETIAFAVLFQAVSLGLMGGLQEAHRRLFAGRWLPLFHQSAAAGSELLLGLALAGLPRNAVSSLLAAIALTGGWAWPDRAGALMLTAMLGLVAGIAAQTVGWAALILLARFRPDAVGKLGLAALVAQVGGAAVLLFAVLRGWWDFLLEAVLLLKPVLMALTGGIAVLFIMVVLRREALGWAYREAWLEASAGRGGGRRRSTWLSPGLFGHPAGARDWATGLRNPLTWGRLAVVVAGAGVLWAGGQRVAVLRDSWAASGIAILLWLVAWAEWVATAFSRERDGITLYLLTPMGPTRLLAGKIVAQWPVVALGALAGLAAGLPGGHGAAAALAAWLLAAGSAVVLVSLAAVEARGVPSASPGTASAYETTLEEAVWEQVPRSPAAWAAVAAATAYAAAVWWTASQGRIAWAVAVAGGVPAASYRIGRWALEAWYRNP